MATYANLTSPVLASLTGIVIENVAPVTVVEPNVITQIARSLCELL